MTGTYATPNLLTDPGFLYLAPLGTALPANTVVGGVFTDAWTVWEPLGMTETGSVFTSSLTVNPITAAETFDPLAWRTTDRESKIEFQLKNFTATNLAAAMNGATSTLTGSADTSLTQLDPPTPGEEIRQMIGWESLDNTVRLICFQALNSGDLALAMAKAPANANIPFTANLEKPAASQPYRFYLAGANRV